MVACNDYTSCLPDCISGMAYDLLAASALLERIAVVVEAVSTQDCSVKFSLREENRRAGIIFSLRWDFLGWEARGKNSTDFGWCAPPLPSPWPTPYPPLLPPPFQTPVPTPLPSLIQTHLHTLMGTLFRTLMGTPLGTLLQTPFPPLFRSVCATFFATFFEAPGHPSTAPNFCPKTGVQVWEPQFLIVKYCLIGKYSDNKC